MSTCGHTPLPGNLPTHAVANTLANAAESNSEAVAPHGAAMHMLRIAGRNDDPMSANLRQHAVTNLRHY